MKPLRRRHRPLCSQHRPAAALARVDGRLRVGATAPPLPNLELRIEVGDSLTALRRPRCSRTSRQQDVARFFELKGVPCARTDRRRRSSVPRSASRLPSPHGPARESCCECLRLGRRLRRGLHAAWRRGVPDAPGFDIIVANPPYVRQELQTRSRRRATASAIPRSTPAPPISTSLSTAGRSFQLLRRGGVASFITSNKWLRAGYGSSCASISRAAPQWIRSSTSAPVFGAIAYPQIIACRTVPPHGATVRALTVDDLSVVDRLGEVVATEAWAQPSESSRADGWALVRPAVSELMARIRKTGVSLANLVGDRFYRGIVTGLNEAFVIDDATRDRLAARIPKVPWMS